MPEITNETAPPEGFEVFRDFGGWGWRSLRVRHHRGWMVTRADAVRWAWHDKRTEDDTRLIQEAPDA